MDLQSHPSQRREGGKMGDSAKQAKKSPERKIEAKLGFFKEVRGKCLNLGLYPKLLHVTGTGFCCVGM